MRNRHMALILLLVSCCYGCMQVDPNGEIELQSVFNYKGDAIPVTFPKGVEKTIPSLELVEVFNSLTSQITMKKRERFSSIAIKADGKITINTFIRTKKIRIKKKGVIDYLTETSSPATAEGRVFIMEKKDGKWTIVGTGTWIS